jgi:hypothetical protein
MTPAPTATADATGTAAMVATLERAVASTAMAQISQRVATIEAEFTQTAEAMPSDTPTATATTTPRPTATEPATASEPMARWSSEAGRFSFEYPARLEGKIQQDAAKSWGLVDGEGGKALVWGYTDGISEDWQTMPLGDLAQALFKAYALRFELDEETITLVDAGEGESGVIGLALYESDEGALHEVMVLRSGARVWHFYYIGVDGTLGWLEHAQRTLELTP